MSLESDKLNLARLLDAIKMTDIKNIPSFLGFLNEREFSVCKNYLDKQSIKYSFSGGYDNATRVYVVILPDWTESAEYPFTCLKFTFNKQFSLSHRDFLGTLMSLGIERDKIGDIIVSDGVSYVFVCNSILKFITENVTKVGGVGVDITKFDGEIEHENSFMYIQKTIASDRADCVVSALCNLSREKAKEFILNSNFIVNHIICDTATKRITENDVLSLRGKGKFVVESITDKTKKGRIKLQVKKYI